MAEIVSGLTSDVGKFPCANSRCKGRLTVFKNPDGTPNNVHCSNYDCMLRYCFMRFKGKCAACEVSFILRSKKFRFICSQGFFLKHQLLVKDQEHNRWSHAHCISQGMVVLLKCYSCCLSIRDQKTAIEMEILIGRNVTTVQLHEKCGSNLMSAKVKCSVLRY